MKLAALIGFAGGAALLWLFARSISAVDRSDTLALSAHEVESIEIPLCNCDLSPLYLMDEPAIRAAGVH